MHLIWGNYPSLFGVEKINRLARQVSVCPTWRHLIKGPMAKTTNNLWDTIINFETLYLSFQEAQKGKRYNPEIMKFKRNLEENLINIQNHLIWGSWTPGRWRRFVVMEPKRRVIDAPPFADRVVHHALVDTILPIFEKKFIDHSYACRSGFGFHAAANRVQKMLRKARRSNPNVYVLKADISKYFQSVSHRVVMNIIRRTIRDTKVLSLFDTIIRAGGSDGVGIPVGALTSQLLANVYLDQLDHYAMDTLGIGAYCRYMDDFIIVSNDKKYLWNALGKLDRYINENLELKLNPKTAIFPAPHGVDFCGYRIWSTHILPRKRTVIKARRRLKHLSKLCGDGKISLSKFRETVMSFLGYMKHCNGYHSSLKILSESIITRKK